MIGVKSNKNERKGKKCCQRGQKQVDGSRKKQQKQVKRQNVLLGKKKNGDLKDEIATKTVEMIKKCCRKD